MLYDVIKRLCDERNLTIMALEQQAGLANATIGKWRKPGANPTIGAVSSVAEVLRVSVDWLLRECAIEELNTQKAEEEDAEEL